MPTSNGVTVPFDPAHSAPLDDSTTLLGQPAALRERFERDGCLLLRRVLPPAAVLEARAAYFSAFDPSYFRRGTLPVEGMFSGRRPGGLGAHGTSGHPAHAFVRSPEWRRLIGRPELSAVAHDVLGRPASCLPRQIVRHFDRATRRASRAHVDRTYLDARADEVVTLWIPLGDCPVASGPLVYLEGSHRLDATELSGLRTRTDRPGDPRPLSHDLGWVAERTGRRWRWADFAAGDLALHGPGVVHASLDVESDAMRLSADVRFVVDGARPDPRWQVPWSGDDGN